MKGKHNSTEQTNMNSPVFFCITLSLAFCAILTLSENLQDACPTAIPSPQNVFINGFPCKNPATIVASDFKTSKINHAGDTDNFFQSSTAIVTAADFPGLNTLGLSIARTDMDVGGIVPPHSHPRASEMFFVSRGIVIVGFIDTKNQIFQKELREGDVFVFPRGLLHFSVNSGFELATAFSVLNSQNPGLASVSGTLFEPDSDAIKMLMRRLIPVYKLDANPIKNMTLAGF